MWGAQGAVHCHSLVDRLQDPAIFVVQVSPHPLPARRARVRAALDASSLATTHAASHRARLTLRGLQDSAGAYPAYIIRYRRGPGAGPLEAQFPAPAGPDSLMARGDAAFRAHLQPVFDAAAAAFAAAAAAAASTAAAAEAAGDGGGGGAGGRGVAGGEGADAPGPSLSAAAAGLAAPSPPPSPGI